MKTLLYCLLFLCVFVGCTIDNAEEVSESEELVKVGDRLPSFSVDVTDGDSHYVFSSDHLTGRTMIVFFNTGCSDCQRELPVLNDYYLRHQSEPGFQMVAIAREESAESIADYWQAHHLSIPYSPQSDRQIYNLFATMFIPRAYLTSTNGQVIWIGIEQLILID